ncbi:tyrosine-type recombinase/integrase [Hydromonas duriensis]|uniref:Site-specific recombinase XerD n=1 Tax=Hydromonas duriensis TaxID=1527608 RepID=A0A4R6Y3V7_9BURK|nr:tyrosine-type recombinase/integrase [Hydromonas duriensis]TDR27009.1 site-specific recombinase XerD [Hydromonas duriensis]
MNEPRDEHQVQLFKYADALQARGQGSVGQHIQTFDEQMVLGWLNAQQMRKAVQGGLSEHTLRAYEFETNKFMGFIMSQLDPLAHGGQYLKQVTVDHAQAYVRYLFKDLSPRSIKRALTILNSLFTYIHNAGELTVQPFANIGVSLPTAVGFNVDEKALTEAELKSVFDACEQLPKVSKRDMAVYHRTRWMLQLMFRTWQRRSEVAHLKMSDFHKAADGWEIRFVGKGSKYGLVMASPKLMEELAVYRQSIGLPPEPSYKEIDIPVLGDVYNPHKPISSNAVYLATKRVFTLAIESVTGNDADAERLRIKLSKCAAHTFRHTGISTYMNNGGDLRLAQSQARHSSASSTSIYDQRDKKKWRDDIELKQSQF